MRFLPLLLSSVLLVSAAHAEQPKRFVQSEELKAGLIALRTGDKAKAWELLFPQAKGGDVQAMFYLGEMMLRSPEYGDNLERAVKFFAVAASKGHAGAKEMVPRVQQMIADKTSGGIPTIAGTSGLPTKADVASMNATLAKYKAEVLRYTDTVTDIGADLPRLEVMVFLAKTDATAERLYNITKGLENQFGTKIKTRYFVVINPAKWHAEGTPTGGTTLPPNGFTPDFKGNLAAQHGVQKLPSVVILPPSGKATVVEDISTLSSLISSLL
ncbi:hypothetical protein ACI77O_12030 [Pseudomonas tritici]|uniref:hypothetical protein n=1 Tax=Pseudomonas tritici TaxID=2745518 RepID=UPI00387AB28C